MRWVADRGLCKLGSHLKFYDSIVIHKKFGTTKEVKGKSGRPMEYYGSIIHEWFVGN